MPQLPHFSDFIRVSRESMDMTPKQAAQALGWSIPRWNAFEQGRAMTEDNITVAARVLHVPVWVIQYIAGSDTLVFCERPWVQCSQSKHQLRRGIDLSYNRKAMGAVIRKCRHYSDTSLTEAIQQWTNLWGAQYKSLDNANGMAAWRDAWSLVEDEGRVTDLLFFTFGPYGAVDADKNPWEFLDDVPAPVQWAILRAATGRLVARATALFLAPFLVAVGEIPDIAQSQDPTTNALFGHLMALRADCLDYDQYAAAALEYCMRLAVHT
ncbi:Helix-turn-helix domain-containing protein [Sulfobacillus thermosulfidooxidans DSM 9293]|uniref:Helix-turn-helix domain-containing protein n=1 Tax=Sulfobacillus thermosulfidooxidans (strain DSM 9293 / VKM B-1269 / AT-1) TaxID=929705 RepID=A0A1W1WL18_SULTA|nr:helix-turn-helix transcriptional regulator [Sulfobacillus thermosulfidooxidans]SMC06925.1 Helix-turn-helix domain-containing protein [Sulfobacillus thermosulfidooxidans DSM 9293]